jgi:hypothetical protein
MTGKRVMEIAAALEGLAKHARSVRLSYALAKNLSKVRIEVESIRKAGEPLPAFATFELARIALAAEHAQKGDDGQPRIEQGPQGPQYMLADRGAFEAALAELRAKHAEAIVARERQGAELRALLDEEVPVELYQVPIADVLAEGAIATDSPGLALLLEPLLGSIIEV